MTQNFPPLSPFLGFANASLDDLGLLHIPPSIATPDSLEGAVITRGLDPCLWILPAPLFASLRAKVQALPLTDPLARSFRRFLFAQASPISWRQPLTLDLPLPLRQAANLHHDVVLVGLDHFIEIWDAASWNQVQQALDATPLADHRWSAFDL